MGLLKKLEEGLVYEMSQSMTTGALELFWLRKAGTIAPPHSLSPHCGCSILAGKQ